MKLTRLVSSHQHQSTVVKEQWSVALCRPSPDLERSVSGERIAPNQCTRIATARFFEGYLPAKKRVIVATFAGPQSRDFKR